MKYSVVLMCLIGMIFGEILSIDSIVNPGNWTDPSNILVSDDLYGQPHQHNDEITVGFVDPLEVAITVDSVFIFVEQHATDSLNALWHIVPVLRDTLQAPTPQQYGTEYDSYLRFDISYAILTMDDLNIFQVQLVPRKVVGSQPDWFADHLYAEAFCSTPGIQENTDYSTYNICVPTIVRHDLAFICTLTEPSSVDITIWNSLGQPITRERVYGAVGQNHITMNNTSDLATGVYFLKTDVQGDINTAKFLFVR
jgi:hypothetical protein